MLHESFLSDPAELRTVVSSCLQDSWPWGLGLGCLGETIHPHKNNRHGGGAGKAAAAEQSTLFPEPEKRCSPVPEKVPPKEVFLGAHLSLTL